MNSPSLAIVVPTALSLALALAACGSPPAPDAPATSSASDASAPGTGSVTTPSTPATSTPAAASAPAPVSVTIGGKALTNTFVKLQGKDVEVHLEQPMSEGNTQLWVVAHEPKKGDPTKVEGTGMSAAFVQIGKSNGADNVSGKCRTMGTVTFDELPTKGAAAKGSIDVTVTCKGVDAVAEPLTVKGSIAGFPVK